MDNKEQLVKTIQELIAKLNGALSAIQHTDSVDTYDHWGRVLRLDSADSWPELVGRAANCAKCGSHHDSKEPGINADSIDPVALAYNEMVRSNQERWKGEAPSINTRPHTDSSVHSDASDPVERAYEEMVRRNQERAR